MKFYPLHILYNNCSFQITISATVYILAYKSIFWVVKGEFPETPLLIRRSYFLPAEGKMFSAILDTQRYRIQPNKSQSPNKIISLLSIIQYYSINNN